MICHSSYKEKEEFCDLSIFIAHKCHETAVKLRDERDLVSQWVKTCLFKEANDC